MRWIQERNATRPVPDASTDQNKATTFLSKIEL